MPTRTLATRGWDECNHSYRNTIPNQTSRVCLLQRAATSTHGTHTSSALFAQNTLTHNFSSAPLTNNTQTLSTNTSSALFAQNTKTHNFSSAPLTNNTQTLGTYTSSALFAQNTQTHNFSSAPLTNNTQTLSTNTSSALFAQNTQTHNFSSTPLTKIHIRTHNHTYTHTPGSNNAPSKHQEVRSGAQPPPTAYWPNLYRCQTCADSALSEAALQTPTVGWGCSAGRQGTT